MYKMVEQFRQERKKEKKRKRFDIKSVIQTRN